MTQRAALYARYSSDIQHDRSIDDQLDLCRVHAGRENLKIVTTFADRAKSGATLFDRQQLWELMQAAKRGEFDVVVVESLDRLSRDQEDLPGIHKRLEFAGVKIHTCNDGATTKMHVGIRGLVSSMFLSTLGDTVRRGHAGRVREGKFPGAVTFGYRSIKDKPGEREIDPEQAAVVLRIFREYAAGRSPRRIAVDLSRDGISTPSGKGAWNHQTFVGGRLARGMIGNPLYAGQIVWNTATNIRNPDTGKKVKRKTPTADHMTVAVPHLRIVPPDLWDRAQAVRTSRGIAKFGPGGKVQRRPVVPRSNHLLSGLLRCECGSHMRIANTSRSGSSRVACAAAHQHQTCDHSKTYDLDMLQTEILSCMRTQLTNPKAIQLAVRTFHEEWTVQKRKLSGNVTTIKKRLADIEASTIRFVNALEKGSMPTAMIEERLSNLETERVGLVERLRMVEAQNGSNVIELHPQALKAYCDAIDKLHLAFTRDEDHAQNRAAFRNIIDSVVVHRTAKRAAYEFTTYHRVEAIMGMELFPKKRTTQEVLKDQGVVCTDNGNPEKTRLPISQQGRIIAFGRWKAYRAA